MSACECLTFQLDFSVLIPLTVRDLDLITFACIRSIQYYTMNDEQHCNLFTDILADNFNTNVSNCSSKNSDQFSSKKIPDIFMARIGLEEHT